MGLPAVTAKTPIYQLEYLVVGEPARNTRAALENNAKSIEAALAARGIPPTDYQALVAAGWFTDTGWTDIPAKTGFTRQTGDDRPQVRKRGGQIYLRGGWTNAGMAASGTFTVATLPAGFRPPNTSWPNFRAYSSSVAAGGDMFITTGGDLQIRTPATLGSFYAVYGTFLAS